MSGCEETKAELSAYLDGELPASDRARIDAHLVLCAACNAELSELEETRNALKKLPKHSVPKRIAEKISAEIRAAQPAAKAANVVPIVFETPQRRSILRFVPYGISAAALLAVALTLYANRDKNTDLVSKAPPAVNPRARDSGDSGDPFFDRQTDPDAPAGKSAGAAGFKLAPGASNAAGGKVADAPSQLAAQLPKAPEYKDGEQELAEERRQNLPRAKPKTAAQLGESDVDDFPAQTAPAPTMKKRGAPPVVTLAPEASAVPAAPAAPSPAAPGAAAAPKKEVAEKEQAAADRAQVVTGEIAKAKKAETDGAVRNKIEDKSKDLATLDDPSGGARRRMSAPAPEFRKESRDSFEKQVEANGVQRSMVFEFRSREPEALVRQLQREVEARGARWVVVAQTPFGLAKKPDALQRAADAEQKTEKKDEGGVDKQAGQVAETARSFQFAQPQSFDIVAAPAQRQELMQMLNDMKVNAERRVVAKAIEPETRGGGGGAAQQTKTTPSPSVANDPKAGAAGQTRVTGEAIAESRPAAPGAPQDDNLRAKSGTATRARAVERTAPEPLIRIEIIKE